MRKAPTISDVATAAGVTKQAVSLALRGKPGVSDATRRRIIELAAELNYQPAPTRQTRGPVHRGQVGFLIVSREPLEQMSPYANPVQYMFLLGCERQATQHGSSMALSRMTVAELEQGKLPIALLRKHVDGVVVHGWEAAAVADALREIGLPFVLADCDALVPNAHQVQIDHVSALDHLAEHLADTGGCRCAMITGDLSHINGSERLSEARRSLPESGLHLEEEAISRQSRFTVGAGADGVRDLIRRRIEFDTLICQSDLIASGALSELTAAGIQARVVGFDNLQTLEPITSIDTNSFGQAEVATQMLLELIPNQALLPRLHRHEVELVVRESSLTAVVTD